MVAFGQSVGRALEAACAPGQAGIGTLTLSDLSADGASILDHHALVLVTSGHGTYEIDFVTYACRPGTLLWARPGQAVRLGGQSGLDATLVCWQPGILAPLHPQAATLDNPLGPTHWHLTGEDEDAVINEVSQLVVDCERHGAGDLPAVLLRHQLAVLLLRIGLLGDTDSHSNETGPTQSIQTTANEAETFHRFQQELERGYARTRRVEDYAADLGCCVRTLTRASLAATGRSAKQVIDDRVALEAKRLLAGTDLPVAEVGRRLGFAEPTNFGRFFQREVGNSPGGFRAEAARDTAPHPAPHRPREPLDHMPSPLTA
ncbi:AraC family transcriptional regulator [Micromonospora sp. CPCC 205371]|nr:AraC family transcriptional regulator [Micromonospora sp. CPCC 205371]